MTQNQHLNDWSNSLYLNITTRPINGDAIVWGLKEVYNDINQQIYHRKTKKIIYTLIQSRNKFI